MMKVEDGITSGGKYIVLLPADGEMAGRVHLRKSGAGILGSRWIGLLPTSVRAL